MANDHTLYVRNGVVTSAPQANQNPSVAQAPNQENVIGTAVKATVLIQLGKQVFNQTTSMIGYTTGDYELQEQVEFLTKGVGIGAGLLIPGAALPILGGLAITTGFEMWAMNIKQQRAQFKQNQNKILTGAVSVNGGRY
jgi:hypothetical protein